MEAPEPCVLCGSDELDPVIFGDMKVESHVSAHYNCLILSLRRYRPNEIRIIDILDYLRNDIFAEVMRCRSTSCFYCHRLGANIKCCQIGCLRSFHTKCGAENFALYQYSIFHAYCEQHVPEYPSRPDPTERCIICLAPVEPIGGKFTMAMAVQAPCCRNGWYHRTCMQMHANSGYGFRCPTCCNSEKFLEVTLSGIMIPNKRYFLPLLPPPIPRYFRYFHYNTDTE